MDIPVTDGLEGRVAIVTGAGARDDGIGNGRAAAILLAASGAKVLCVDKQVDLAERTVAMIEAAGFTALAQAADAVQVLDFSAVAGQGAAAGGPHGDVSLETQYALAHVAVIDAQIDQ